MSEREIISDRSTWVFDHFWCPSTRTRVVISMSKSALDTSKCSDCVLGILRLTSETLNPTLTPPENTWNTGEPVLAPSSYQISLTKMITRVCHTQNPQNMIPSLPSPGHHKLPTHIHGNSLFLTLNLKSLFSILLLLDYNCFQMIIIQFSQKS